MAEATIQTQMTRLESMTPLDIIHHIRWDGQSKKGSVYDVIELVTGCPQKGLYEYWNRVKDQHPEVPTRCGNLKFSGRGQKETPVADTATLIEIAWLCPGKVAAQFRRKMRSNRTRIYRKRECKARLKMAEVSMENGYVDVDESSGEAVENGKFWKTGGWRKH
jgi:hypothetical protein